MRADFGEGYGLGSKQESRSNNHETRRLVEDDGFQPPEPEVTNEHGETKFSASKSN